MTREELIDIYLKENNAKTLEVGKYRNWLEVKLISYMELENKINEVNTAINTIKKEEEDE